MWRRRPYIQSEVPHSLFSQTYEKEVKVTITSGSYRGKNRGAWAEEATGQTGTWVFANQAIEGMIDFPEVEFV